MKRARADGYAVTIDPEDGRPLCYTIERGGGFLSDPVVAFLLDIPKDVILGLLTAWLYTRWDRRVEHRSKGIVLVNEDGERLVGHDIDGRRLSDDELERFLRAGRDSVHAFQRALQVPCPDPAYPLRVQLEHSGRVVAWAQRLENSDSGLKVVGLKITDPDVQKRVDSGELCGLSTAGVVTASTCSICGANYVNCNHVMKETYDGRSCVAHISQVYLAEISITQDPINADARF